jgi:mono/diheme cytochrome c family protein
MFMMKIFYAGLVVLGLVLCDGSAVQATRPQANKPATAQGDAGAGRVLFNGKGVCYYCHGVDGQIEKRPQLAADTAALIARLSPPPSDLRNSKALHLKNDKQRAKAVREGHPGTGMFPDTTMSSQELADTLAYLGLLRKEGAAVPK